MAPTNPPGSPSSAVRVALVDDDSFVLTALRNYLASSERIEVASAFGRGRDALAFLWTSCSPTCACPAWTGWSS